MPSLLSRRTVQGAGLALPLPQRNADFPLARCIGARRSVRGFRDRALAESQLGQLLWAAQGTTGADGERAVPSAGALYPLELYVHCARVGAIAPGTYRYRADRHELVLVSPGDARDALSRAALEQDWIATAAAVVCVAAVFERTTAKYGARGRGYVYMEAGLAAESLMLQAVALDLATTMVGAFSDDAVARVLRLGTEEIPLCLIPVGCP